MRENATHVRTRQPADGDAGAAGRTEQEGEEPEDQQGRGLLRAKAAKAKAKATAKAAVGETDKYRAGGQNTNKGLTDKGRATAFSVSEQVCLSASQLVRFYGDPKLFKTITVASLQSLRKKVDDRLTDTLVAEYSLGYTPCGDRSSDKPRGIQILTDLRTHQKNLFVFAKLTADVVATSGLATEPRALLNAKT